MGWDGGEGKEEKKGCVRVRGFERGKGKRERGGVYGGKYSKERERETFNSQLN